MSFDVLIVLDCGDINTESSTDGKEEKKRVWTKRKDDEKNRMLSHWCFWLTINAHMCEEWKTGECGWEWSDGGRVEGKEKRVEEKEEEKREKGKSGFGKKPFCFCLTVSLPLPLFILHPRHTTTPQHTLTLIHHSPLNIQHDALVHTITCKQVRVLCCLFLGSGQRDTLHHPHPTLHHLTPHNTHQQTNPTQR